MLESPYLEEGIDNTFLSETVKLPILKPKNILTDRYVDKKAKQ